MTRHRTRALPLALGAALLMTSPAAAQRGGGGAAASSAAADEEARFHFRLGNTYYEAGRFQQAAEEFQKAYDLSPRPELLYNVFVAWRDAGQLGPAIETLRRYLAESPDLEDRPALERRLANMERLYEQQRASGTVTPTIDEADRGPEPEDRPLARPEPEPTPASEPAPAAAPPADAAPADEGGGSRLSVPGLVLVGLGGGLIVGGVVTGVLALNDQRELEDRCPGDVCPPGSDAQDLKDRGNRRALLTDVFLITGGVAAATGVILMVLGVGASDEAEPTAGRPRFQAGCGPGGCAASMRLAF